MTRRVVLSALLLAIGCSPASAATVPVNIEFAAFSPADLVVLPGDTVEWTNSSERKHTVTAFDDSFDSGDLLGEDRFAHAFDATGGYSYHCTVHQQMVGHVEVDRLILGPLPAGPLPAGQVIDVRGRSADPGATLSIERSSGGAFVHAAAATVAADGSWQTQVRLTQTADYRVSYAGATSEVRRVLVTDRKVHIRATRRTLEVTVTPPAPNQTVVLQLNLRERFGWWTAQRATLDYLSRATFRFPRALHNTPLRVALVDRDGWSPVAFSPTRGRAPAPSAPQTTAHRH